MERKGEEKGRKRGAEGDRGGRGKTVGRVKERERKNLNSKTSLYKDSREFRVQTETDTDR